MFEVKVCSVPDNSLLAAYRTSPDSSNNENYCDCFSLTINGTYRLEQFVYAFYTTWVFRIERKILAVAVNKPSTDEQARQVASGEINAFSAWTVESRRDGELLLRALGSRTGSWFMVRHNILDDHEITELLFGSVILSRKHKLGMGLLYHSLLGFHKLYSRVLLSSAKNRLVNVHPK